MHVTYDIIHPKSRHIHGVGKFFSKGSDSKWFWHGGVLQSISTIELCFYSTETALDNM